MSQFNYLQVPTGNFKWEKGNVNLAEYTRDDAKRGIILEVDLEYPNELHDLHNGYPLAPESKKVDVGLNVTKVHRVLSFDQSPLLAEYIDFNTKMRSNAKNDFEKNFFKLMNNSVFGKTMENLRKIIDFRMVTNDTQLKKLSKKPTLVSFKIFNEDLVAVKKIKECLILNKPAYLGMCILDLSKTLMYDFHYNYIKEKYGNDAKLLFTDTDSLMYEIITNDIYKELFDMINIYLIIVIMIVIVHFISMTTKK
jgi:hypothetical protein